MPEDASATYRGFRNQALYALSRLLTDEDAGKRIYRPEGSEDLAIFDSNMRLVEVIQVKDHTGPLSLSHFKPDRADGFFARLCQRTREHPYCNTILATFGPVGPEMAGALKGDAKHRARFTEKLCELNPAITPDTAVATLDALAANIARPNADDLRSSIVNALGGTIAAADIKSSIDLLTYWVFDASEKQRDLTRQGLLLQLEQIGHFLTHIRDTSSEWGVSVVPIHALTLTAEEAQYWIDEYRQGVQARWEHIVAGADCARPGHLQELHAQFRKKSVVIVRGASGQGKSTLGWRYLHDFCADGLRFHIRQISGVEQARRIANALGSHIKQLGLNATAYVDVSPADVAWPQLIRELAAANLKVLVAVREEDFRRANVAVGDFDYSEIVLDRITREEAAPIYSALSGYNHSHCIDFEEVWSRFAATEGGPLLEFTHLVTAGETLNSRIAAQIRRIQRDSTHANSGITESHLELLALAAVANETGARIDMNSVCTELGLSRLGEPLQVLEREYLIRIQHELGGYSIGPLHSLRSKAIVSALFDQACDLWDSYALRVVPMIIDEDLESFLLSAFSRRPDASQKLRGAIHSLPPRSWRHTAGMARSLLWEGVNRYEKKYEATIRAAVSKYNTAWWLARDSLVGMDRAAQEELFTSMRGVIKADFEIFSLGPSSEVYEPFSAWAADAPAPPPPTTGDDWVAAGDVAHWVGHTKTAGTLRTALASLLPTPLPPDLTIEELGQFVSGRGTLDDSGFQEWHRQEHDAIVGKYVLETSSDYVHDDLEEVKVYFSVSLTESSIIDQPDAGDWHGQTMKRVRLLRLLFPHRRTFSSQGLGLEFIVGDIGYDPTRKQIPVENLPSERAVRVNAIFANLVAYRHLRPKTWEDYATRIYEFRRASTRCFRGLHRSWARLFSEKSPRRRTIASLPGAEIEEVKRLSQELMFPRAAVDEWGFLSEERQDKRAPIKTMQEESLKRFDVWRKAFRDYETGISAVANNIVDLSILYLAEKKGNPWDSEDDKKCHLTLVNLADLWAALDTVQEQFITWFGAMFDTVTRTELEQYERTNFVHVWAITFAMRNERGFHTSNLGQVIEADLARQRSRFLTALQHEIQHILSDAGKVHVAASAWSLGGVPHLLVFCDFDTVASIGPSQVDIIRAMHSAANSTKWKPLEWKPIEIEWPKIALVNLVRGKALAPAISTISTLVLFGSSDDFQVKPHHYAAQPIAVEEFRRARIDVWESPLIRAIVGLEKYVGEFIITAIRLGPIATMISDNCIPDERAEVILADFAHETSKVWQAARRSYVETMQVVATTRSSASANWALELKESCELLLMTFDEEPLNRLDPLRLNAWVQGFEQTHSRFRAVVLAIVEFATQFGS